MMLTGVNVVLVALLGASVGSCAAASHAPRANHSSASGDQGPEYDPSSELACEEPLNACSMAGAACPSNELPSFSTQLDPEGWTRLRALAKQGPVAVVLGEQDQHVVSVELVEDCQLPGRYHEGAAAAGSSGRAWASDRLVFLADEVVDCARATHFVASFAIRTEVDGAAVALPLPCPPIGSAGAPVGCIGAGLDDATREAAAKARWEQLDPMLLEHGHANVTGGVRLAVDMAALMPEPWSYVMLSESLRFLREEYGGCLWLSEAAFAANAMHPEYQLSKVDLSNGRVAPTHGAPQECETRPSFLTCFPERFTPGKGENCW